MWDARQLGSFLEQPYKFRLDQYNMKTYNQHNEKIIIISWRSAICYRFKRITKIYKHEDEKMRAIKQALLYKHNNDQRNHKEFMASSGCNALSPSNRGLRHYRCSSQRLHNHVKLIMEIAEQCLTSLS